MLNGKQRAQLRGIANTLDTTLHVGKGGVTENVIKQAADALTAHEIIKCRALENSSLTAREAAESIAAATQSEIVQTIGSRFVLYKENKKLDRDKRIRLISTGENAGDS